MSAPSYRRQKGSSIVELVTVAAVMLTLSAMAIINGTRPSQGATANAAADVVVDALHQARQLAIAKRRNVVVTFTGTNTVGMAVQPLPTDPIPTALQSVQLNSGAKGGLQFYLTPGLPNTPMGPLGFGNASAIDLEPVNGGAVGSAIMFTSTGSLVGAAGAAAANYYAVGNNNPINATIYIGLPGTATMSRAITVVGATGRVRAYYWTGNSWQQ